MIYILNYQNIALSIHKFIILLSLIHPSFHLVLSFFSLTYSRNSAREAILPRRHPIHPSNDCKNCVSILEKYLSDGNDQILMADFLLAYHTTRNKSLLVLCREYLMFLLLFETKTWLPSSLMAMLVHCVPLVDPSGKDSVHVWPWSCESQTLPVPPQRTKPIALPSAETAPAW